MKTENQIDVELTDISTEVGQPAVTLPFRISFNKYNISITPKGYGDCDSETGFGTPVLIEIWKGKPRVIVWDDINNEEGRAISLENAAETNRKTEETDGN